MMNLFVLFLYRRANIAAKTKMLELSSSESSSSESSSEDGGSPRENNTARTALNPITKDSESESESESEGENDDTPRAEAVMRCAIDHSEADGDSNDEDQTKQTKPSPTAEPDTESDDHQASESEHGNSDDECALLHIRARARQVSLFDDSEESDIDDDKENQPSNLPTSGRSKSPSKGMNTTKKIRCQELSEEIGQLVEIDPKMSLMQKTALEVGKLVEEIDIPQTVAISKSKNPSAKSSAAPSRKVPSNPAPRASIQNPPPSHRTSLLAKVSPTAPSSSKVSTRETVTKPRTTAAPPAKPKTASSVHATPSPPAIPLSKTSPRDPYPLTATKGPVHTLTTKSAVRESLGASRQSLSTNPPKVPSISKPSPPTSTKPTKHIPTFKKPSVGTR